MAIGRGPPHQPETHSVEPSRRISSSSGLGMPLNYLGLAEESHGFCPPITFQPHGTGFRVSRFASDFFV